MTDRTEPRRYHHGDLRAALLEAAERSIRAHGVAQLSLRNLARDVGVSHAAPRRHFPERQDLLDALAQVGYARLGASIRSATEAGDNLSDRIRRAASSFAHFAMDNPALLEVMNATKHRPGGTDMSRTAADAFAPILDLIVEGQKKGALEAGPPEEIAIILYATINGITTLANTGAIDVARLDDLTDSAVTQFLRGVAP